ncbi:MAG TPA: crossover junction endodeoxyribonuclease RuvC [Clostridiales bacterium]|nr:crossover junction endodeoxyribonuclease RuvC [Clostridiales bacterium]HQP69052.1 crossover junction endodeoxyribonuclease RuvC [Clostridiales bacterium]
MKILGIDPGISCTGYAVLDSDEAGKISLIELGVIRTLPSSGIAERLKTIFDGVCEVIDSLQPEHLAIESVFVGKNIQSALKLGHARGAAIVAASKSGLEISEFSPREVKQNITGNGNADKEQVQFMVKSILKLTNVPKPNDASDAVAIALSYIQTYKYKQRIKELK